MSQGDIAVIISRSVTALAVIAVATACGADTSRAGGGDVAAGIIGGFAAGAIVGAATAPRPYYGPAPVYVAPPPPPPAYVEPGPPPACYWTRGEPVWNGYAWVRPRMQVCE
jgi:hypothetical protein